MATLVTVTCDRCGSIIPQGARKGQLSADLSERWESVSRSHWEVCESCYDAITERIGDVLGVPSEDWRRPPEPTEAEPDPIAVAQRVLDGGEGPE